jgi:23S rRNA (pseudouridine1915-N3)-methyltransferase
LSYAAKNIVRAAKIRDLFYSSQLFPHFCLSNNTMKFKLWSIGKAHEPYVKEGVELFTKRISNYYPVEWTIISLPKNAATLSEPELKKKEGEIILNLLHKDDYLVLLDEKGKQVGNKELATFIQARANDSVKTIVFLIGGAYGASEALMKRADYKWSLSQLVFPHQLVRLILAEQLYRTCTIIRNEKYHHN